MKKRQNRRFSTIAAIALIISLILAGSPLSATVTSAEETSEDATTSISVICVWYDGGIPVSQWPESVTVQLYADSEATGDEIVLNESNAWSYTWTDLDVYADGEAITYTVDETDVPDGYTCAISGDPTVGFTIINTRVDVTDVSVRKVWNDSSDQDGLRPDSVTVQLYANGDAYGDAVVLSDDTGWSHTWMSLDSYLNYEEITYTVEETDVPSGYTAVVSGNSTAGYTITNTHVPETTSVSATAVWNDSNDQDGLRPDSVTVQLYADGEASGDAVVLSEDNNWAYTWSDLYVYANGEAISYTVEETVVPDGYTAAVSGDSSSGFTITNTHVPETTSISATTVWNDSSNQDGLRPDSVTVQLYADGEASGDAVVLSEDNDWAYTWSDLDVYANGEAISYTVEETVVPDGYTAAVSGDSSSGFTITNTHVPETTLVSVTKAWNDGSDQYGLRPDSVTVQLYSDGEASGNAVVLSEDNDWTYTWTGLDVYADGEAITYTVEETDVPDGYTAAVSGDSSSGFTITNTLDSTSTSQIETPRTGDSAHDALYALLLLASAAGVICLVHHRRMHI